MTGAGLMPTGGSVYARAMTRLALLTPDPADEYGSRCDDVVDRLRAVLAPLGEVWATPWVDHLEDASGLAQADLILPLVAWGYHRRADDWRRANAAWAEADLPFGNPPGVLGWNSDKAYLGRMAADGLALPPTLWRDRVDPDQITAAFDQLSTDVLVVKPTVSAGAWKTLKIARGDAVDPAALPTGPSMIQPFLGSMQTEGETSLLFFGGRFSHAVNKRPAPGEFRIQVQFGGLYRTVEPDAEALRLAQAVLDGIGEPLLYARIDMARGEDGRWLLMEAELIEPDLYLNYDPAAGAGLATAVRERLGG